MLGARGHQPKKQGALRVVGFGTWAVKACLEKAEAEAEGRESSHMMLETRVFPRLGSGILMKTRAKLRRRDNILTSIPKRTAIFWKGHILPGAHHRSLTPQRRVHASQGPCHQESLTSKEGSPFTETTPSGAQHNQGTQHPRGGETIPRQ